MGRDDAIRWIFGIPIALVLVACNGNEPTRTGVIELLTYNVAGLPQGMSSSNPETNIPLISPRLNDFDLVLVQEDFWYHEQLIAEVMLEYASEPWSDLPTMGDIGDGLNRFSRWPFGELTRIAWPGCNGALDCASNCLASKGFSLSTHVLDDGVEIDVYNLHMEAGGCPEDAVIREDSISELLTIFEERSRGRPVIVAGDFNLHEEEAVDEAQLRRFIDDGGFEDGCWLVDCGETNIDRVFLRAGGGIELSVRSWEVPQGFVDAEGVDLSDHEPVAVTLEWRER